eukprot:TRINITY_DN9792_c1_g1_i1.p1 TRINITY_DN9792_c1_g1~~TRINITY_DN9792_c1_g1_i1.p1  ORF type:complete len:320 (+),score=81.61 TRINITY_DN9792_c1_g1_i1:75-1034(+)
MASSSTLCAGTIQVIDPANRTGKIQIPIDITTETVGRSEWLDTEGDHKKDVSLCMLYQQRRCNAGVKCNQIHADKGYIARLRQEAEMANPRCCPYHDGLIGAKVGRVRLQLQNGIGYDIDPLVLSRTATLDALMSKVTTGSGEDALLVISTSRICRLHQRNACKYGKDCKNIHICREVGTAVSQGLPPKTNTPPTLSVPTLPSKPRNAKRRMSKDTIMTSTPPNEPVTLGEHPEDPLPSNNLSLLTQSSLEMFQAAFRNAVSDSTPKKAPRKPQKVAKKGKRGDFAAEKRIELNVSCGSDMFGDSFSKICLPRDLLSPI